MCVKARVYVWVPECVQFVCLRPVHTTNHPPPPPPFPSRGGGVFVGALPVADALQADWPPNRIICCGLTPH